MTDSGEWGEDDGVVYRIAPGGATEVWTEATPRFPNGCCLTAGGEALLVVESHGRAVVRVPIQDDGGAGRPEPVVDLTGSQPDGIALAEDGTMFVGCYRPDRIYRIPPGGPAEVFAEDPDGVVLNQPANVAFWGPNLDRLVVSSLGGWSLVAAPAGMTRSPAPLPVRLSDGHLRHQREVVAVGIGEERHVQLGLLGAVDDVRSVAERDAAVGRARGAPPRCRRP